MNETWRRAKIFAAAAAALLLSACNTVPVSENISQKQAIEIVAALGKNGISAVAEKESAGRGKYSVEVKRAQYAQAVALLQLNSLPAPEEPSFSDLIAQKGILPNSREIEALRLDRAMAAELEEALQAHPSVAAVKVIVRQNSLAEKPEPGVSAVIRLKPGTEINLDSIRAVIQKTVPGVHPENISVEASVFTQNPAVLANEGVQNVAGEVIRRPLANFLWLWSIPEDDYNGAVLSLIGLSILVALVGGFFGYWYAYDQHAKTLFQTDQLEGPQSALALERPRTDAEEI